MMRYLILAAFLLLVGCGSPRAGQTRDDIAEKYGAPVETVNNADGTVTCTYHDRSFWAIRIGTYKLHVVTFKDNIVVKGE